MGSLKRKMSAAAVAVLVCWSLSGAVGVGLPFGFQSGQGVGVRLSFGDFYALQPLVMLDISENETNFTLSADNNFFIAGDDFLRQYVGVNVNTDFDGDFGTGAYYGLQHRVSQEVDVYGQLGVGITFDPTFLSTFNTGVGVIFYISR
ncbi:MAG: hypothetical protein ACLFQB_00990 [Chitinispirillaceae bacterium]